MTTDPEDSHISDGVDGADGDFGEKTVVIRNRIFVTLYHELRALAAGQMLDQSPAHVLQPTALVHEVFLRLSNENGFRYVNKDHFLATAARAMRSVLVDHARGEKTLKRGGESTQVPLDALYGALTSDGLDLVKLDEALSRLRERDPRLVELVELRFFSGLEMSKIADLFGESIRTIQRDWSFTKKWLRKELR